MRKIQNCRIALSLVLALLSLDSFAQAAAEPTFVEKNLPSKSSATKTPITKQDSSGSVVTPSKVKDALTSILIYNQTSSLMFDDEENGRIDRAIDSFKNNQIYTPDELTEGGDPKNLSKEEQAKAAEAEKIKQEEKRNEENEKSYIYLASIIYFTPRDWVVWINDKKITSETNDKEKELYLKSVQKDHIKLLWKLSMSKWKILSGRKEEVAPIVNKDNQVETTIDLKINQTFILSTSSVVEGRAVIALLKKKAEEKKAKAAEALAKVVQ